MKSGSFKRSDDSLIHHGRVHKTCHRNISNMTKINSWIISPPAATVNELRKQRKLHTSVKQFPGQTYLMLYNFYKQRPLPVRGCQDFDFTQGLCLSVFYKKSID